MIYRFFSRRGAALLLLLLALGMLGLPAPPAALRAQATVGVPGPGDWPMFLNNPERQNWNADETALSPATAPHLRLKWKVQLGPILAAAPAIVGDSVYIGSWDGYEYALNTADGSVRWKAFLGATGTPPNLCKPNAAGITSGAAVDGGRVYVGGGADQFFTLDAATGQGIWTMFTGQSGAEGGHYNWASPLVADGRVYSGIASFCDHPLVRGYVWGADASSGANARRAYIVRENTVGGGIWTSPTLDRAHNRIFATTGTPGDGAGIVDGIVTIDLNTYTIVDGWRVPAQDEVHDADFGTTPTLFTLPDGKQMVAAGNKNGWFYVFNADHLGDGPVWKFMVAQGGECPQCGEGTIASGIYRDGVLYLAGGHGLDGQNQPGAIRAFDAATGNLRWTYITPGGPVMGSPAGANGVIAVAGNHVLDVIAAADGRLLFRASLGLPVWAGIAIAHGVIYVASNDGYLWAFEVPPDLAPPPSPPTATPAPPPTAPPAAPPPAALNRVPTPSGGDALYFEATGHTLAPPLRAYWEQYGGLAQFGYPLTEPFMEAVGPDNGPGTFSPAYLVQYFERARFEYHPENRGTPSEVLLGLLGVHFHAPDPPAPQQAQAGYTYLNDHNFGGPFLRYWQAHGGLFVNGYPISEERDEVSATDGKTYRVQYFERARMEYHPEYAGSDHEVLLGLLGVQLLHERGWLP